MLTLPCQSFNVALKLMSRICSTASSLCQKGSGAGGYSGVVLRKARPNGKEELKSVRASASLISIVEGSFNLEFHFQFYR